MQNIAALFFRFQEITHQRSLLTRRSRTRRARERQSVAGCAHFHLHRPAVWVAVLPGNVYFVEKKKRKKGAICARKPSKPPHLKSSFLQSPLCADGNGTLNQCLAPSGFITRWQPHCGSSVMTTSGSARRGEQEKVRQMVQGDDNGAISQRILHLWRDGGCCRGLLMPAEMNAMDEHISYWQPPYRRRLRCLDTAESSENKLCEECLNFGLLKERACWTLKWMWGWH